MNPEYLEELADLADPDEVWKRAFQLQGLTPVERRQVDTGVALRRYASHMRRLHEVLKNGQSLLITPLSESGAAVKAITTPADHVRLRNPRQDDIAANAADPGETA